jgi:cytochrome P450
MLIDPKEHKVRKDTIKPLFAPRSVENLAPVVLDVVYRAIERAKETYREGHSLNIQLVYQAITVGSESARCSSRSVDKSFCI